MLTKRKPSLKNLPRPQASKPPEQKAEQPLRESPRESKAQRVIQPDGRPTGRCANCDKQSRTWVQVLATAKRWFMNSVEYDGPQYEAVCTVACADELATVRRC